MEDYYAWYYKAHIFLGVHTYLVKPLHMTAPVGYTSALMIPTLPHLFTVCCQINIMINVYLNILLSMTTIFGLKAAQTAAVVLHKIDRCKLTNLVPPGKN